MSDKTITISINEYIDLLCSSEHLNRLESGGVDNWKWYDESVYGDDNEISLDDFRENLEIMYGVK